MTSAVPAHLVGTRAALFFLWGAEAARPLPVETPRPLPQASNPDLGPHLGLDRVRAALQSDVFVFSRGA